MSQWHTMEPDGIYERLETSENGLSSEEAGKRLIEHGKNALVEQKKKTLIGKELKK